MLLLEAWLINRGKNGFGESKNEAQTREKLKI